MSQENVHDASEAFLASDYGQAAKRHAETVAGLVRSSQKEKDAIAGLVLYMLESAYYRGFGDGMVRR